MAISEQIKALTEFALAITKQEGEEVSLDEVYQRWWQERHKNEDLLAIKEAHAEYESGDRGQLAREEVSELQNERESGNNL